MSMLALPFLLYPDDALKFTYSNLIKQDNELCESCFTGNCFIDS